MCVMCIYKSNELTIMKSEFSPHISDVICNPYAKTNVTSHRQFNVNVCICRIVTFNFSPLQSANLGQFQLWLSYLFCSEKSHFLVSQSRIFVFSRVYYTLREMCVRVYFGSQTEAAIRINYNLINLSVFATNSISAVCSS